MKNYIAYGIGLLTDKGFKSVQLKAMGRAIHKTVAIAEIIKRRVKGLHQNTTLGSIDITEEVGEDEEHEGLRSTRHVSVITITLSSEPLDETAPGYQAPLPEELVQPRPGMMQRAPPYYARGMRGGYRGRGVPRGYYIPRRPRGYPFRGGGRGRGGAFFDPAMQYHASQFVPRPPYPYGARGQRPPRGMFRGRRPGRGAPRGERGKGRLPNGVAGPMYQLPN